MNTTNMNTQNSSATAAANPQNMKIDDKAIKKMVGEAIGKVEGVLGVEGNLTDLLKPNDDNTKGIGITMAEDGRTAQISAKIITEYGKNIPSIVDKVQDAVERAVLDMAGIAVDKVEIEVTDTMSREEYQAKTNRDRNADKSH